MVVARGAVEEAGQFSQQELHTMAMTEHRVEAALCCKGENMAGVNRATAQIQGQRQRGAQALTVLGHQEEILRSKLQVDLQRNAMKL